MSQWEQYGIHWTVEVEVPDRIMNLVGNEDLAEGPNNVKQDLLDLLHHNQDTLPSQWMEATTSSDECDWSDLPHVVLEKIFSNLNEVSLLKAQFVCKRWYDVIRHSASLWREKTFRFSGRDPRDLTHGPYKYASNFTRTFGRYLHQVEFKLFSPVSSGVCKKFQKCVKVCLNNLIKSKSRLTSFSLPCLQLDRSHWMLYREDMCTSLARFFCKSQHTIERVCFRGARANFDDGYKVLYALGYNTGGTVTHLNISDMIVCRRPLFDCPQFVESFKNFKCLRELELNYSYISEELLETLAASLHENSLRLLTTSVTQYDPHNQVIWGHSWKALADRCRDLRVEFYFQRVMTYEQHFRILLPQIPLSEVSFDGCYFADRDWQICPTVASILPRYKSTLERIIIELPDTREIFENELLSLIMLCPNLWYVKMSAYVSTRFLEKLLEAISERKCNVVVIKMRIYVRDYDTETEEIDLERIYNKYRDLIMTELHDYYATCCVSM